MMKDTSQCWAIYYIAEEYDSKLAEITSRQVFGHEETAIKWVREKLYQEQRRAEASNPGAPFHVVTTECTGKATYYSLELEGDELLGYYLSPARYYP